MTKNLFEHIEPQNIVYQSNHFSDMVGAIAVDMGIGIASTSVGVEKGLVEIPFQVEDYLVLRPTAFYGFSGS